MISSLNEVAIFVAAVLAVAVESIWYSPLLFGAAWRKSAGLTPYIEDVSSLHMVRTTVQSVVVYILFFACAVQVIDGMGGTQAFLQGGGLLCVLLVTSLVLIGYREFRSWTYAAIHTGFIALTLFGGVGVIMYWPW